MPKENIGLTWVFANEEKFQIAGLTMDPPGDSV